MAFTDTQKNDYHAALAHLQEAAALFEKIGRENQRDYSADYYLSEVRCGRQKRRG